MTLNINFFVNEIIQTHTIINLMYKKRIYIIFPSIKHNNLIQTNFGLQRKILTATMQIPLNVKLELLKKRTS